VNVERDIDRFLRLQLFRNRERPLERFALRHAAPGSKGTEVESFNIPEEATDDAVKGMASDILERAQSDADGMGGLQRYVLIPYEKGVAKGTGRLAFRLSGQDEDFDGGEGEEAPTHTGQVKQLMRHNEALARINTQGFAALLGSLERRVARQDDLIEHLITKQMDAFEVIERARSEENERDIRLLEATGKEKRTDLLFEKIQTLLPVLINRIAGKRVMDSEDPTVMMIRSVAEGLSPEQFQRIGTILKPEQAIAFYEVVRAVNPRQLTEVAESSKE
jgi:CheY-like chemotaxis protein